jgi:hypothetical protein
LYCPICDAYDREVRNIIDDVLYCINTETLPNEGGCMDQSALFRMAYTILKSEREIIKNEREKEAIDKAKNESKNSADSGRKRGSRRPGRR